MERSKLRIGDRVRLLSVPGSDLKQRERELLDGLKDAGWTADTIERILDEQPIVFISRIDEYGFPWFDVTLRDADGDSEEHSIAIMDDVSWEPC